MRSTSVLLAICIITITLSCLVSFTQAEGLKYRYTQYKRADTPTPQKNETTSATSLTTGGSYTTGGSNSTTGGGLTTGAISSGNSTANSTGTTSGQLTSGSSSSTGGGSTSGVTSGGSTSSTTGQTSGTTEITIVTFVITYRVSVDPATFNFTAAQEKLAIEFGIDFSKVNVTLRAVSAKRFYEAFQAVGDYELVVTITAIQGQDAIADSTPEQMIQAANGTAVRGALQAAGVTSVGEVGVTKTTQVVIVTGGGSSSTTGSSDAATTSGGLSAGAIAGIVIAIVAVVAIVVVIVIVSKKRAKKHSQVQPLLNNNNNGPHYP